MNLFHMQEEAVGQVFWHPKGYALYRALEDYVRRRVGKADYQEVKSPLLIDRKLWDGVHSIPLYQRPTCLAWRGPLRNVVENPTLEGPLWNAESWAFAAEATP